MTPRPATAPLVLAALLLLLGSPAPGVAQDPLPDEPATTLYQAALELEAQREFDLADSLMDFILRRYPDSAASSEIRRARSTADSRRIDSSGRTELVVFGTLYGLWLGGAVPGAFGVDDPEPYGLGLLVGGPLGFLATRGWTADSPVGEGDAEAISWGGTWGTWQGFGWAHVLDDDGSCETYSPDPYFGPCDDEPSAETVLGSMILAGAAGTATGLILSRRYEIDPGDATSASLGSLWGSWYGGAAAVLFDLEDDAALGTILAAGDLGLLLGAALGSHYDISRSRARIASIAGVAGGLAGAGIDLLVQPDDEKLAIAIPLVTSTVGLALGLGADRRGAERPDRGPAPGRLDWRLGGPVVPVVIEGEGGERAPAVAVTILSGRF